MGTMGYMSPEQVRGGSADQRADIFAFGAVLYEMLSGKRAFQKPTSAETMTAILNEDPQAIFADRPEHPSCSAESPAPLPGKESGAALPIGLGSGVRTGGALGFG